MINKQEIRTTVVLSCIFALRMLGLCMLLPIFAVEALQYRYANAGLIGMAVGAYGLAQAGLQLPFGWASDRYGRKPLILIGLCMIMLGSLIAMCASNIYGLILGRLFQGCGSIGSVVLATLSDNVREQVRARSMAILGATIGLSFALALVLGPWLNQALGFRGVFAVIAMLAGICCLLVINLDAKQSSAINSGKFSLRVLAQQTFTRQLLVVNFGVFVLHATLSALFLILPLILQQAGIVAHRVWQFYLGTILIAMLVAWRVIAFSEFKQNIEQLQKIAIICLFFAEVLLYTIHNWFSIAGSMIVFFSAFCVLEASLPALVTKYAASSNRGTALGLYSCLQFMGVFMGGMVGGWLHNKFGALAVLCFCVFLGISWLILGLEQRFFAQVVGE